MSNNKLAEILRKSSRPDTPATTAGLLGTGGVPRPDSIQSNPGLGLIAVRDMLGRQEVTGLYYNGKVVTLAGYTFKNCRFDNCRLIVSSDNFALDHCIVDPSTVVEYSTNLLRVIRLFLGRYDWAYAHQPFQPFVPTKNPDGTITVG
jgi:hypothetical protein